MNNDVTEAVARVEQRLNKAWANHGFITLTVSDARELLTLAKQASGVSAEELERIEKVLARQDISLKGRVATAQMMLAPILDRLSGDQT